MKAAARIPKPDKIHIVFKNDQPVECHLDLTLAESRAIDLQKIADERYREMQKKPNEQYKIRTLTECQTYYRVETVEMYQEPNAKKTYQVNYYYLATGMEGIADERSEGTYIAKSKGDAIDQAIMKNYSQYGPSDRNWIRGCLSAEEV